MQAWEWEGAKGNSWVYSLLKLQMSFLMVVNLFTSLATGIGMFIFRPACRRESSSRMKVLDINTFLFFTGPWVNMLGELRVYLRTYCVHLGVQCSWAWLTSRAVRLSQMGKSEPCWHSKCQDSPGYMFLRNYGLWKSDKYYLFPLRKKCLGYIYWFF